MPPLRLATCCLFLLTLGQLGCDAAGDEIAVEVSGQVLNASRADAPIAGIPVYLWDRWSESWNGPARQRLVAQATTGPDGRFVLAGSIARRGHQLVLSVNVPSPTHGPSIDDRFPVEILHDLRPSGAPIDLTVRLHEFTQLLIRAVPANPPPPPGAWLFFEGGWVPGAITGVDFKGMAASDGDSVILRAKANAVNPASVQITAQGGGILFSASTSVFCPIDEVTEVVFTY